MRELKWVPLDEVREAERNPKRHAGEALALSIGRFGFADAPIVDARTGRLVAGHGRIEALRAARARGEAPPEGVRVGEDGRWEVPMQLGWRSRDDAEAEAYLLAHNRVGELGGWDLDAIEVSLRELAAARAAPPPACWNEEQMAALRAAIGGEVAPAGESEVRPLDMRKGPLPRLAWLLVGVPLEDWPEIASYGETWGMRAGWIVETALAEEPGDADG